MVGVDDEQSAERVDVQGVRFERLVWHGEAHAQEIVHIAARIIGIQHRLIAAPAEYVAHDRAHLGHDDVRGPIEGDRIGGIRGVGVERGQGVHGRGEHAHGVGVAREGSEHDAEILTDHRLAIDVGAIRRVLLLRGQFTEAQQPGDLEEIGLLAQLLDGVSAIPQDRAAAVDIGDPGLALRGGQEPRIERHPAVVAQIGHLDAVGTRGRLDDGQHELLLIHFQFRKTHEATLLLTHHHSPGAWNGNSVHRHGSDGSPAGDDALPGDPYDPATPRLPTA